MNEFALDEVVRRLEIGDIQLAMTLSAARCIRTLKRDLKSEKLETRFQVRNIQLDKDWLYGFMHRILSYPPLQGESPTEPM